LLSISPLGVLLERIRSYYGPEQIWLFGSRARGDARADSDWDLLVVVPDGTDDEQMDPLEAWRLQKNSGVYADVIPCRRSDFEDSRDVVNNLCYEVAREGVLLYER
jgi:uncharacterized protein